MTEKRGLGALGWAAAAIGAAALAGLVWYLQGEDAAPEPVAAISRLPEPAPATSAPEAAATTPAAPVAQPEPAAVATPAPVPPAATTPEPPRFDTVRVTPEGAALVAGRADPGATVAVLVDGASLAEAVADPQGAFVVLFDLTPSDQPRLLSLLQKGTPEVASVETVALSPIAPPVTPVAQAAPAPEPAPEPEAPVALLLTEQGAQVLQGDAPVGGVSIGSIAYTPDGAVQLAGQGQGGAMVRLYLDAAPLAEVLVAASGQWFATLRDIAPGLYTLRADQIGPDGAVTARFETPFQRETPEALAAVLKPRASSGTPLPTPAASPAPESAPLVVAPAVTPAAAPADTPVAAPAPLTVTVQPGFTLWRIARENFGDGVLYVKVFEANKGQIRNPDLIYPGQVFTIPDR